MSNEQNTVDTEMLDQVLDAFLKTNSTLPPSLVELLRGYGSFATYLVLDRAIISVEDGLKPSQRRILYMTTKNKKMLTGSMTKSSKVCTDTTTIHPHGEGPVYDTLVRMVDTYEGTHLPFFVGEGSFGTSASGGKAAAPRYTSVRLGQYTKDMLKDIDAVDMVPTEDGLNEEPVAIPMTVPYGLLSGTTGIAVGLACKYVPYNSKELVDAIINYMDYGVISDTLVPDFPTGGVVVNNPKEFDRIMRTGRGSVTVRGKWRIEGKNIVVTESPFYTNLTSIKAKAEKLKDVYNVEDNNGLNNKGITIEVKDKDSVSRVLTDLLRSCGLQKKIVTNMNVLVNGEPKLLGTTEHIAEWLNFRRKTKQKSITNQIGPIKTQINRYELLMKLLGEDAIRDKFLEALTSKEQAESKAIAVIRGVEPEADSELIKWVLGRPLRALTTKGKDSRLQELYQALKQCEKDLNNIDKLIKEELMDFKRTYGKDRLTETTDEELDLTKEDTIIEAEAVVPCYVEITNKFVKKISLQGSRVDYSNHPGVLCNSDDVISIIDSKGRILRVLLRDIPFNTYKATDLGTYLTGYLGLGEDDSYDVVAYDVIAPRTVGYSYTDGYVSTLNLEEWYGNTRFNRVSIKGVSDKAGLINSELDLDADNTLAIIETSSGDMKIAYFNNNFSRKSRLARTKMIKMSKEDTVVATYPMSQEQLLGLFTDNCIRYMGKATSIAKVDGLNIEMYKEITGAE